MPIEIPELGDQRHRLWCDLVDMADAFPNRWTLIGAHMVALYAWDAGIASRPSDDVDVLVNVRVATTATQDVTQFLRDRDYDAEPSRTRIAHLFKRGDAEQIDVLAPDGLGAGTNRGTIPNHRTVMVPGGTQALRRTGIVTVRSRDIAGDLPRPNLLGAILIKVRAINVDEAPDAQRADVALLLGLVDDPDAMARELSRTERKWLKKHSYFADPASPRWDDFHADDLEQSALVYGRLIS